MWKIEYKPIITIKTRYNLCKYDLNLQLSLEIRFSLILELAWVVSKARTTNRYVLQMSMAKSLSLNVLTLLDKVKA